MRSVPEISKTMQAILILVCPSELGGKTLLLKTPHTLATGHRKARLITGQEASSWPSSYTGLGSSIQATGRKSTPVLPSCEPDALRYQPAEQDMPLGAVVV